MKPMLADAKALQEYIEKDVKQTLQYIEITIQLDADGIIIMDAGEEHMWWTTIKGENIRIDKMDTSHLKNTMAMLKRNGRYKSKRIAPVFRNMQEEYYRRLSPAGGVLFGDKTNKT